MQDDSERVTIRRQPERRQGQARRHGRMSALLHVRARFQTVVVVDYSEGGVQIEGSFGLVPGDVMTLELLTGHRIDIRVVWSLGSKLGASFSEQLVEGDPVLAALEWSVARGSARENPPPNSARWPGTGVVSIAV
jgi:uncharacterized protein (DUF58 family)